MEHASTLKRLRLPWCTLALTAGAFVASLVPALAALLVYDRAAIMEGELWRLASGHLVHFSSAHLAANLLVLLPTGYVLEIHWPQDARNVYAIAMPLIGIAVLLFEPGLAQFGGASGVVFAILGALAARMAMLSGRWRICGAVLLAGLLIKLIAEFGIGWSFLASVDSQDFVAVPLSHLAGLFAAALAHVVMHSSKLDQMLRQYK